ncbi:FAD-dependent oxidoreductase, partial [Paenibacillus sonchi]
HGAAQFHAYARETGIISELLIEERALNHEPILENGWTNSVWDMVLYNLAVSTPNLTLHLNSTVTEVHKDAERHISSVTVRVAGAETQIAIEGRVFIDCTGDGVVADLAGCEWRWGSEGREEFSEPHAPLAASGDTMGSSIHFKAKDMGRPVPFAAPDWAVRHEDPAFFYDQGRHFYDLAAGYWWIEIGIPWNTIYDNEHIRHELTRHALGIWDWIKNRDPLLKEKAANYALDWIGQVPGKRESRRVLGRYFMTEHDPA